MDSSRSEAAGGRHISLKSSIRIDLQQQVVVELNPILAGLEKNKRFSFPGERRESTRFLHLVAS